MAKPKRVAKNRPEGVVVDFSDSESREGKKRTGGRKHYPEGDYAAKCTKAELGKSGDKETPRVEALYKFTQGKYKGKEIRDDLYLTPKSLWRLRQTLEAMEIEVPSKKVRIDPKKMVGKEVALTLEDDEYDEKTYSRVVDTFLLSELEELAGDEDDEDLDEDDDEADDDEDEDEDDDDDDEDEDEDADDDLDLDEIDDI